MTAFAREGALVVALAVAGAAHADPMVCRTEAGGGTLRGAPPLNHYRVTGTRQGNRTSFEDNKGRRWMMIEEDARSTIIPVEEGPRVFAGQVPPPAPEARGEDCPRELGYNEVWTPNVARLLRRLNESGSCDG
jgi:hypothetical protein